MGYVFNFNDAVSYEQWFNNPQNRFAADLESRLMVDMLSPMRGETLLDIGCGTGARFFLFFESLYSPYCRLFAPMKSRI